MKNKIIFQIRAILFTIILIFSITTLSFATDYFVDAANGNDVNSGTQAAPWKTLVKVNGFTFKPGDNVYFKSGGVWDAALTPAVSGSNAVFITYAAYGSGSKPVIRNCSIKGKSYIKIQGIKFSCSTSAYPMYLESSSNIWITNCEIYAEAACTAYAALRIYNNSHHNKLIDCIVERRNLSSQGDAISMKFNASYNLLERNRIGSGTHYGLYSQGADDLHPTYVNSFNVVRNNIFNNMQGAQIGFTTQSNNNLIEGNTISGGKSTPFCVNSPAHLLLVSANNIVRKNIFRDNPEPTGNGIQMVAYQYNNYPPNLVVNNHVYNNTITNLLGKPIFIGNDEPLVSKMDNNHFKNNIIYNNAGYQVIVNPDIVTNNYFSNNIFFKLNTPGVLKVANTSYSVDGIQKIDARQWVNNIQLEPALQSNYVPIINSPVIDAGDFLTKVTSISGVGKVLTVSDAGYFTDGFGIIPGDSIRIGNTTTTIVSVSYAQNTITVVDSIAWKTGDLVSLPYSGTKPDIGTHELESINPPTNLRIVN